MSVTVSLCHHHITFNLSQSKTLPIKYPAAFFTPLLVLPARTCLVAYRQGQPSVPIAFISAVTRQPASRHNDFVMNHLSPDSFRILDFSKPFLEILTLGVLPAYQHCGLARRLINCVVDKFHQSSSCAGKEQSDGALIFATVSTSNMSALRFYECMGMFISSQVISNLYRTISHGSRDAYLVVGTL
jgi:ribosomal protein S18 acetylase RimI-like enzyme